MNERHLTEQVLLTHPYFHVDEFGDRLSDDEKVDRISELKDGFLIGLKREKNTNMEEIHKAVGVIVGDPERFYKYAISPLALLRQKWVFDDSGKTSLKEVKRSKKYNDEDEEGHGHMPKHIKKHFDRLLHPAPLSEEEAANRRRHLAEYPDTVFVSFQNGQISRPFRPGRGETA
jgi:hypothetical protein